MKIKYSLVQLGKKSVDLDLLDVQRRLALALTKEYQAIAEYNNSLARLEFARGTIMQHDNVVIAENGMTPCAQIRAVDHEQQRTKAFVLREAPTPMTQPGMLAADPALPDKLDPTKPPPELDERNKVQGVGGFENQNSPNEQGTAAPGVQSAPGAPTEDPSPALFPEPAFKSDAPVPSAVTPTTEKENWVPSKAPPAASAESSQVLPAPLPEVLGPPALPVVPKTAPAPPVALPSSPPPLITLPAPPASPRPPELPAGPPLQDIVNEVIAPATPRVP